MAGGAGLFFSLPGLSPAATSLPALSGRVSVLGFCDGRWDGLGLRGRLRLPLPRLSETAASSSPAFSRWVAVLGQGSGLNKEGCRTDEGEDDRKDLHCGSITR